MLPVISHSTEQCVLRTLTSRLMGRFMPNMLMAWRQRTSSTGLDLLAQEAEAAPKSLGPCVNNIDVRKDR